jgi:hypothetical protein
MSNLGETVLIVLVLMVPFVIGWGIQKCKGNPEPLYDSVPEVLAFYWFLVIFALFYWCVSYPIHSCGK